MAMVQIDREKCIGCGACQKDCFFRVIAMEEGKAAVQGDCFRCGHCVAICPVGAVSMPDYPMEDVKEYEKGAFSMEPERLLDFIRFRRSVRQFKKQPIPRAEIESILEAGRFTPTAGNRQDVSYIVLQKDLEDFKPLAWEGLDALIEMEGFPYTRMLKPLREAHMENPADDGLFFGADALLLVLGESSTLSAGLAACSIELMAQAKGIGVLYSGFLQGIINISPKAKAFLGLDGKKTLCACMLLGYPDVQYRRTVPRKPAEVQWR